MLTLNVRAVAEGNYALTGLCNLIILTGNFFLIKKISTAKSKATLVGYAMGGSIGSILGVFVMKFIYGK